MELKNEILKDYEEYCHQKLISLFGNYKINNQNSMKLYQRYKHRILKVCPRMVIQPKNFIISSEHTSAYREILNDISQGRDLKKYQSRKLKNIDYNDDMLSHWGIQHFHLGDILENDGFVSRTSDLLFIHFTDTQAHIIGLYSHGDWLDLDIIETIHKNWPEILIEYKSTSIKEPLTSENYRALREKNYNTFVMMQDGTEYFPPGAGVMCDGTPILAINRLQKLMMVFEREFDNISLNINQILDSDPNKRTTDVATIGLEMDDFNHRFIYKIKETGHLFTLNY